MGISGRVLFAGFQDNVQPYLYAADVFVLTSDSEGLPLSVLEAMATGLPCVVTDVGGNSEAIEHNINGFLVPPGSPVAVANAIMHLQSNPRERARMSHCARERVYTLFNIEETMAELQQAILT